jgi:hypothetical protein
MSTWNQLLQEFMAQAESDRTAWMEQHYSQALADLCALRANRNVIVMASAFLSKPEAPPSMLSISPEDINGLMSVVYGMDCDKGLSIVLHTPGGQTNATETIVAYLWSKFSNIEVIVPAFAMSAGTMIALASNRIVMGRQSQLGPIDPQMGVGGNYISARAIVEQFNRARLDIVGDPSKGIVGDMSMAHVWAPVLATIGPALMQEAVNALEYSERMVAQWLAQRMVADYEPDSQMATEKAKAIANHFNDASVHLSHGRRIGRDEARGVGVVVEDLEDDQKLQEAVLTLYHLMTITFEQGLSAKMISGSSGGRWIKNWVPPGTDLQVLGGGPNKARPNRPGGGGIDRNPPRPRKPRKR